MPKDHKAEWEARKKRWAEMPAHDREAIMANRRRIQRESAARIRAKLREDPTLLAYARQKHREANRKWWAENGREQKRDWKAWYARLKSDPSKLERKRAQRREWERKGGSRPSGRPDTANANYRKRKADGVWRYEVRKMFGGQLPPEEIMDLLLLVRRFRQETGFGWKRSA